MLKNVANTNYYGNILRMPDNIILGSFQDILKVDVITGRTICRRMSEESQWNTKVIKLPHGRIASSNKTIKIWKIQDGSDRTKTGGGFLKLLLELKGHTGFIFDMVYLGSNFICSASSDRTLRIWNTLDGLCLKMIRGPQVFGKLDVFSIDRCLFVSACNDGFVKVWNWISGKCIRSFSNRKCVFSIVCMNEKIIVAGLHGNPCEIKCWNVETGECVVTLRHGKGRLYTLEKLDRYHFVSGCEDSTIKLWCVRRKRRQRRRRRRRRNQRNNNNVIIIDDDDDDDDVGTDENNFTGTCVRTFEGHRAMILYLTRFFSPKLFFSCQTGYNSTDGIKLWSTVTGSCLKTYDYLSKGFVTMESTRKIRLRKENNQSVIEKIDDGSIITELAYIRFSDTTLRNRKNGNKCDDEIEGEGEGEVDKNDWKIPMTFLGGLNEYLMNENNVVVLDTFAKQSNRKHIIKRKGVQDEEEEVEDESSGERIVEKYQNPILRQLEMEESSPYLKIDRDDLFQVFMDCLLGEDTFFNLGRVNNNNSEVSSYDDDEKESVFFDLYELFDSLKMKNHSIVILHKISDMRTNSLLFVFLKSLLKYEKDRIDIRDFSPKAEDYILDQIPFSLRMSSDSGSGGFLGGLSGLDLTSMGGSDSGNIYNISNLLASGNEENEREEEEEEEVEEVAETRTRNNIIPRLNMNQYLNDGTIQRRRRRRVSPPNNNQPNNNNIATAGTIPTTSVSDGLHHSGLPFKKTAFRSPFTYVCFRELKKRKIEISRNPIYLKHLEQVGILKNVFFFREDMMASLSSTNKTFISTVIRFFHEKEKQEKTNFMGDRREKKKQLKFDYDLEKLLLDEEIMSFEKLYKMRLRHLFETKEYSNLTLLTKDGGIFEVHKEVLMNRSSFFSQMFLFDGIESCGVEVLIEYLSSEQLQMYLTWIYTGRLDESIKNEDEVILHSQRGGGGEVIIMIDEDEETEDNNSTTASEEENITTTTDRKKRKKKTTSIFDRNRDKESKVLPLLEMYRHCEMYGEIELKFFLRNELIDLLNKFGTPNSTESSSSFFRHTHRRNNRRSNNNENNNKSDDHMDGEELFFSYIHDKEEEENTEIENLLLRVGHIFQTLPDMGEDIFVNSDWVKKKKIGSYRSIRSLIRSSAKVQEYVDMSQMLDSANQKIKELETKLLKKEEKKKKKKKKNRKRMKMLDEDQDEQMEEEKEKEDPPLIENDDINSKIIIGDNELKRKREEEEKVVVGGGEEKEKEEEEEGRERKRRKITSSSYTTTTTITNKGDNNNELEEEEEEEEEGDDLDLTFSSPQPQNFFDGPMFMFGVPVEQQMRILQQQQEQEQQQQVIPKLQDRNAYH